LINAMTVDIADGRVHTVRSIINLDKLSHLGPLADISAVLKQRRSRSS
jgi:RNA polymerase sigma-70 factor (ECF subfamily)